MEMTCGNLTYARAKDAIFVCGKKIVDKYRMPWKINKPALHIIDYNRTDAHLHSQYGAGARVQLLYLLICFSMFALLLRSVQLMGLVYHFGSRVPIYTLLFHLWWLFFSPVYNSCNGARCYLCVYVANWELTLLSHVPCLNTENAKYSKMSAFGRPVVSSVLLFNLAIASFIHSDVW